MAATDTAESLRTSRPKGPEKPSGGGWSGLVSAMLFQAVQDVRSGRECNGACRPDKGWHCCAPAAWQWLNSFEGRGWLEALGVDPDKALAALPRPEGGVVHQERLF